MKLCESALRKIIQCSEYNGINLPRCISERASENTGTYISISDRIRCNSGTPKSRIGSFLRNNPLGLKDAMNHGATLEQSRRLETASATFRERRTKTAEEIEKEFAAASTIEELKSAFEAMDSVFDENDMRLGIACLRLAQKLESEDKDPEVVLPYAKRALNILQMGDENSVTIAMALQLMGSVHHSLKKLDESLGYLSRSNKILEKMDKGDNQIQLLRKQTSSIVQMLLGDVKSAMGRKEEALSNYTKSIALKEEILNPDHPLLADTYRQVAEAYIAVLNYKEALPLCLKALQIHRKKFGDNSVEAAIDRKVLSVIYSGAGEIKKALSENEIAKRVFKNRGMTSEFIKAELDFANVEIMLGKYDNAILTLATALKKTEKESKLRGMVLLSMARALCSQKKFADAKKCCQMATEIFSMHEKADPIATAETYSEIALLYETTNELPISIKLYERALGLCEDIPQHQHTAAGLGYRLAWIHILAGSIPEAIPYLEKVAEKLKESFGPNHYGLGYIHNILGVAYQELDRPQAALQLFSSAKTIMENSLGTDHLDTIETVQNIAKVYALMGSNDVAVQMQQEVVKALEKHGPSARGELKEAVRCLNELEKKIHSSGAAVRDALRFLNRNLF